MSRVEIRVPQLPESVADATLVAWRKEAGQAVSRDENLADLETDKVVLEVPAPVSGVLREVHVTAGKVVKAGELLAILEAGASAALAPAAATATAASAAAAPAPTAAAAPSAVKLGPAAQRVAAETGLSATAIAAAATHGRASKADLLAAAAKAPAPAATRSTGTTATVPALPPGIAPATAVRAGRVDQRVPMTRLRQRIAERLVQAQATQALLTTFNEVDLSAVIELRNRYKESFEQKHGVKLGFMSFFVKAAIEGLKKFPMINASVESNDIVYHEYFDIGVAVSTDRGLLVPIVRDADQLDFAGVESAIADYSKKAREGSIALSDLTGGTFSITNGGVFGSLLSTPIVNAPQSAIMGMHKTMDRPVAVDGQVVVRPMMYLALTYDHRLIDGRDAVRFLVAVKECLESPGRLLLGV